MNLEIQSEIPKAAMERSSHSVSLVLDSSFSSYVYRENSDARENWEVALGKSQSALFTGIFKSAFGKVAVFTTESSEPEAELVFIPRLVEIQLATPSETGFTFFEAWLNYELSVRAKSDNSTKILHIIAYGKENTARFQAKREGLHKAVENALRDTGAKLTIELIEIANVHQANDES